VENRHKKYSYEQKKEKYGFALWVLYVDMSEYLHIWRWA